MSAKKAEARVLELAAMEQELETRLQATRESLPQAEEAAALAEFNQAGQMDTPADDAAGTVTQLREREATLIRSIEHARSVRRDAILTAFRERAQEVRKQAAALREQADKRQAQTAVLLSGLRELEGIDYVPGPRPEYLALSAIARPLQYGTDAAVPKSAADLAEAARLEAEALQLEAKPVPESGTVVSGSLEGLLDAIRADPFRMAPTRTALTNWLEAADHEAYVEWRQPLRNEHKPVDGWERVPRRIALVWRAGRIVEERSTVTVSGR